MTVDEVARTAGVVAGNDRALDVLDALISRTGAEPWGVRELAAEVGASRSTVNRVLQGLAGRRLAHADSNGAYSVGPRLRVLARTLYDHHPALGGATNVLEQLASACDATVMVVLHGPDPAQAFVARVHDRPGPVRYHLVPGMALPLHAGAAGRAILCEVGAGVLGGDELPTFSPDTVTDREALEAAVAEGQRQGFVTSIGQHIPLAAGVAAPFRLRSGLVGAISVTRSKYETSPADLSAYGPLVRAAADTLAAMVPDTAAPLSQTTTNAAGRDGGSALTRIERLLTALVAHPAGFVGSGKDIAALVGAVGPTAERLRTTALLSGLAVEPAVNRLGPGPLLLRWATLVAPGFDLVGLVRPEIEALALRTGETVGFVEYDPTTETAKMAAVAWGSTPLKYGLGTGVRIPLFAGAAGKAILAFCDPDVADRQEIVALNPNTVHSLDELRPQLDEIRARGWATGNGERIPDAFGVAAPFFTDGRVSGSVTISIPSYRADDVDLAALADALLTTTTNIGQLLSVNEPGPAPRSSARTP